MGYFIAWLKGVLKVSLRWLKGGLQAHIVKPFKLTLRWLKGGRSSCECDGFVNIPRGQSLCFLIKALAISSFC